MAGEGQSLQFKHEEVPWNEERFGVPDSDYDRVVYKKTVKQMEDDAKVKDNIYDNPMCALKSRHISRRTIHEDPVVTLTFCTGRTTQQIAALDITKLQVADFAYGRYFHHKGMQAIWNTIASKDKVCSSRPRRQHYLTQFAPYFCSQSIDSRKSRGPTSHAIQHFLWRANWRHHNR